MNSISGLLNGVQNGTFLFNDVVAFIDAHYSFAPTTFKNGTAYNPAGTNNGSCKVFAFAKLHNLGILDTLALFAEHYQAVKQTPNGTDHQNIRQFNWFAWTGIIYDAQPLKQIAPIAF